MNYKKVILIALSISAFNVEAVNFKLSKDIQHCLSLPAYGNEKNQSQCKDELMAKSERQLNEKITKIHLMINTDYDTPYHLNDIEGSKIKDVFWEKFLKSQKLWQTSRDELCAASATLVGEWATSQDDIKTQCILDQNKDREEFLEGLYLK